MGNIKKYMENKDSLYIMGRWDLEQFRARDLEQFRARPLIYRTGAGGGGSQFPGSGIP